MLVGREVGFVPNGLLFVIGFVLSEGSVALDCWLRGVRGVDLLGVGVNGPASPPETMVCFGAIFCCTCENVCGPDECDRLVVDPVRGVDRDTDVRLDGGVTTGVGALGRLASMAPGSSWAVWANPAAMFWASVAQADGGGRSANWT